MILKRLKEKLIGKGNSDVAFWFVRHGESEGNALGDTCPVMHDTPLTDDGRREAEHIRTYLVQNKINITDVYTSPKGRSNETAQIIADGLGLPVKVKEGLTERDWGLWKDLRWVEASDRLEKLSLEERYTFVPDGGESWEHMETRLFSALEEIADENTGGENILIVMHRGGLRAALPIIARAGKEKHKDFSVPTGSLSKFSFDKESFDFLGLVPKSS
jgi:probable phosphoglycerate mutase